MSSKWIEDIKDIYIDNSGSWIPYRDILERVDKLLRKAMLSTDDENLSDLIRKELIDGTS